VPFLPTRRLAVVLAVAALAVLLLPLARPWSLVAVDAAVLVVAALDVWIGTAPGRVTIERELPEALSLGGTGEVTWRVGNPTPRLLRVAFADELAPSLGASSRRFSVAVPAGGMVTLGASLAPTRRGRFEPTRVVVRVEGPLGLAYRQRARELPGRLRVLPRFPSRHDAELRVRQARLLEVGLRSAPGRGGGTDFDSLREYTVDDEVRRMDWAATARADKPIVRTYRAERNQQVIVLLDAGRMMAGRVQGVPRIEQAMDAAMALTVVASGLGDRCGLVGFDREVRTVLPPRAGTNQLRRMLDALSELEPQLVESDYRLAFTTTLARFPRRSLLVVLSELSEAAVTEVLASALPLLAGRHLVVVGSVTDPDVLQWTAEPPAGTREAYRAAAAWDALDRRALAAARLRARGAVVVDAPPGHLAARLCDVYLDIKAAGRL
jgi:uncharacterized protein (DUF58 family)